MTHVQAAQAAKPGRIDRARMDAAVFPSTVELPLRFDDLDVLMHVNNVSVIALLQEARVHFSRDSALPSLGAGLRTVVGGMNVEYAGELTYPGALHVSCGILGVGRSSYTFAQLVRQNGASAVYAQVTMVITDADGPATIPDAYRQALEACGLRWA